MISEGLNDRECDGIAEQTAQPRLSITVFCMGLVEYAMPGIEE